MEYSEKLRDPRWQKKRLEIFNRDNWHCQWCTKKEVTLAVHHLYYDKGKYPWDYPNEALITLCEGCHNIEYKNRYGMEMLLLYTLRTKGYSSADLEGLAYGIETLPDESISADIIVARYIMNTYTT